MSKTQHFEESIHNCNGTMKDMKIKGQNHAMEVTDLLYQFIFHDLWLWHKQLTWNEGSLHMKSEYLSIFTEWHFVVWDIHPDIGEPCFAFFVSFCWILWTLCSPAANMESHIWLLLPQLIQLTLSFAHIHHVLQVESLWAEESVHQHQDVDDGNDVTRQIPHVLQNDCTTCCDNDGERDP